VDLDKGDGSRGATPRGFDASWKPPLVYGEAPPDEVARLIADCVAPQREQRIASAAEVVRRLEASRRALAHEPLPLAARAPAPDPAPAAAPASAPRGVASDATAATVAPQAASVAPPVRMRSASRAVDAATPTHAVAGSRRGSRRGRSRLGIVAGAAAAIVLAAWLVDPFEAGSWLARRWHAAGRPPEILSFQPDEKIVTVARSEQPRWFSVVLDGVDPDAPPRLRWILDDEVVAEDTTVWEYDPRSHRVSPRTPGVLRFVVGSGREPRQSHTWWIQATVSNLSPVLLNASHKPGSTIEAKEGDVVDLRVDAYDPDGDRLSFSWRLDGRPIGRNAPAVEIPVTGSHTVSLAISDGDATVWSTWQIATAPAP
jgi:hypothetical protein